MLSLIRRHPYVFVLLWAGLFFFTGLGSHDLTSPDEPRFGLVAKEMLQDGHIFMPHRNQEPYPDKPPLFFWLIALFSALNGGDVNGWTGRLPSALAATGVLLLFFRHLRTKDETLAWLTTLAIPVSYKFFYQAHTAQIDMTLCFFTTAAMITGFRRMNGESQSNALPGLMMGFGILAKGPVGYLIPAGALLLYGVFKGNGAWRRFPAKILLWGLVPPLIWLLCLTVQVVIQGEWAYFENLLFKQTVVRYLNPWHHYRPWYYFPKVFSYEFLPWTFFLLAAVPFKRQARANLEDLQRFCWAVVVFTLVFFSLSKGKRDLYILPLYPFAACLVAYELKRILATRLGWGRRLLYWVPPGLIYTLVGAGLAVLSLGLLDHSLIPEYFETDPPVTMALFGVITLISGLVTLLFGVFLNRSRVATASVATGMVGMVLMFYLAALPWVNPYRSARVFCEEGRQIMLEESGPYTPMAMVFWRSAYVLYGFPPMLELATQNGEPFDHLPRLEDFFAAQPEGWVIIREDDLCQWQQIYDMPIQVHYQRRIGRGELFFLISLDQEAMATLDQDTSGM